jgi:23S rRNA-/tRNA-specific pseudouridylate synthase
LSSRGYFVSTYRVSVKPNKKNAVGFPPPLLGEAPYRLPVLAETADWFALDKPAGVGVRAYPWDDEPDLDAALNSQLRAEKPELVRRQAELFGSVYYLDPSISGVAVFAKNRDALADLRNRFGSGDCRFRFQFVTAAPAAGVEAELRSDAPLLPHNVKPKMIPSTAKGKKAFTDFKRIAESPKGWALWEARVDFFRPHQVRAHAAVLEIPILGDKLYGGPVAPTQRELHPKKQRSGVNLPSFHGIALHLTEVQLIPGEAETTIFCEPPKHLRLLLRRMGLGEGEPDQTASTSRRE